MSARSLPRRRAFAFLLQVLMPLLLLVLLLRNLTTQQQAARHFGVTARTVRNWISNGLITGYKLPGGRAIRVDLDEITRVMAVIPTTVARPNHGPAFGPNAKIVTVTTPVVVDREQASQ